MASSRFRFASCTACGIWAFATAQPYKKCARIVGDVLGKMHPHGDTAVYDALARLAQPWNMRYPLIDGQGNFGSVDGDPPAAMRYTEARLSAIAEELLFDIDKNTVDFRDNFDGTFREPTVLPAKLPNLLLNGAAGIAVGMATNIPPHNLTELCNAIIYLIENPDATVEDLIKIIPGPDFPTAGMILGTEGIMNAYSTGRGHITLRAKAHIEESRPRLPTTSWSASCPTRSTRPACKSGSPRWPRNARSRASAMCATSPIAAACAW